MPNNLSSNITQKVARVFLAEAESARVLTKTIDTQLFAGDFTPEFGSTISVKRPHDYTALRTAAGDISTSTKSDIISGKASATVQNYITVATEWTNKEEALDLDQLAEILRPAATRAVTELELSLGRFMISNVGLRYGSLGTVVDAWTDVAGAQALMDSTGVPMDERYYVMNPYTAMNLASAQTGIRNEQLVKTAWERSQISMPFGGMKAMASNALATFTTGANADLAGALAGNPDVTYETAKDTMTQSLSVSGFGANAVITAGSIITIAGRHRINLSTKQTVLDSTGARVVWSAVVTSTVTLSSAGAGTIVVAGPAIFESTGAYNTVDSAPVSGDVVTVLGTASTLYQPSLFFHKQAFTMATVKLPKLYSTDTVATTKDGISIRVSKYSDGDKNQQKIRFDILPAFGCMNPLYAGQGYGV